MISTIARDLGILVIMSLVPIKALFERALGA